MARKIPERPVLKSVSPASVNMGTTLERLQQPIQVGDITAGEALEIRARNELIKQQEEDAQKALRLLNVVRNEKVSFIEGLLRRYDLDMDNQYSIDDSTGAISMVARKMEVPDQSDLESEVQDET